MNKEEYGEFIKDFIPKEDRVKNGLISFFCGGLIGLFSEILLELYSMWFNLPRKDSGVMALLTLVIIASLLTAFGVFDVAVSKLKSALIIPITGFAHSITSAALDYRSEGLILGIGANIFKLAGSVILYGIVAAYIFGFVRVLIMGG